MNIEAVWPDVVTWAVALLSFFGGVRTVPIVYAIKDYLGWTGRKAQLIWVAVSVFVGLLFVVAFGVLTPEPITSESIIRALTIVLIASKAEYDRIKNSK